MIFKHPFQFWWLIFRQILIFLCLLFCWVAVVIRTKRCWWLFSTSDCSRRAFQLRPVKLIRIRMSISNVIITFMIFLIQCFQKIVIFIKEKVSSHLNHAIDEHDRIDRWFAIVSIQIRCISNGAESECRFRDGIIIVVEVWRRCISDIQLIGSASFTPIWGERQLFEWNNDFKKPVLFWKDSFDLIFWTIWIFLCDKIFRNKNRVQLNFFLFDFFFLNIFHTKLWEAHFSWIFFSNFTWAKQLLNRTMASMAMKTLAICEAISLGLNDWSLFDCRCEIRQEFIVALERVSHAIRWHLYGIHELISTNYCAPRVVNASFVFVGKWEKNENKSKMSRSKLNEDFELLASALWLASSRDEPS